MNRHPEPTPDPTEPRDVQPADHDETPSKCLVELLAAESDYAEFGVWMDVQLEKLVAEWGPSAAPRARQAVARSKFGR